MAGGGSGATGGGTNESGATAAGAVTIGGDTSSPEGGSTIAGGLPNGGAAQDAPDPCDAGDPAACLEAVTGVLDEAGNSLQSSWFVTPCMLIRGDYCGWGSLCLNDNHVQDYATWGGRARERFPIGGVKGHRYKVTFNFNAVAVARVYGGGVRDEQKAIERSETQVYDSFYRDGAPDHSPGAFGGDEWQLTVLDDAGREDRHYYMNSFPSADGNVSFEGSSYTFLVSYTKSIVVVGGGVVELLTHDPNCNAPRNCIWEGLSYDKCLAERNLPNEDPNTSLPAQYPHPVTDKPVLTASLFESGVVSQPLVAPAGHLTVTAVERTEELPTKDYP